MRTFESANTGETTTDTSQSPIMAAEVQQHVVAVSSYVKYSVFVGIALLRSFDCLPWIWGNLAVYVTSYLYAREDDSYDVLINWLLVVAMTAFGIGMTFSGKLGRKFGDVPVLIMASLVLNLGFLIAYLTIDSSAEAMCVASGIMIGLSEGVLQSGLLRLTVRWTEKYQGFATSWASSFNMVTAPFINLAITMYINPDNSQPNSRAEGMAMFTQKELLNMVPLTFLQLFIWSTAFGLAGILLLRERPGSRNIISEMFSILKCVGKKSEENFPIRNVEEEIKGSITETDFVDYGAQLDEGSFQNVQEDPSNLAVIEHVSTQRYSDVTPFEVLKRKDFYALCICCAGQMYAFFLESNYYKTFGLLHIPEDHFLTVVGMLNCVCSPIFSWLSGCSVDRLGVKVTVVVTTGFSAAVGAVFYLTVYNKWSYLICCMLYGGTLCTVYSLTPPCCVSLYGQTYFTSIIGMLLSSSIALGVAAPLFASWIFVNHGWFVLFLSGAVAGFVGLLALIWGLPEHPVG